MTLMEARLQILLLIILLCHMKTLLRKKVIVVEGASVHDTHVVSTFCLSMSYIAD